MRIGKTTIVHFISQIVTSLSGFASTFAIAYFLGADGLGTIALISAIGFFWLLIPTNAVDAAVEKRVSESDGDTTYLSAGLLLNLFFVLVLAGLVLFVGEFLSEIFDLPDVEFIRVLVNFHGPIAILMLTAVLFQVGLAGLRGTKRVGLSGTFRAVERIGRACLQVLVLVSGFGIVAVVLGHALALLAVGAVAFAFVGVRMGRPNYSHMRSLLSYARYSWLGTLQSRVFGWMDTLILGFFVSASFIGIYEAAWGLASLLAMISASIRSTLFPEISELGESGDFDRIHHYLNEGLMFGGIFVIPGFFGCLVIGQRVLQFYRPEFGRGAGILLILVLAYAADVYGSQFLNVLNGIDRPDIAFRVNMVFVGVNVVLNIVLIAQIGWYGAAIATLTSTILRFAFGYWQLSTVLGRPEIPLFGLAKQVLAAAAMSVGVFQLQLFAPPNRLGTLFLVCSGAMIYVVLLLVLSPRVRNKVQGLIPSPAPR